MKLALPQYQKQGTPAWKLWRRFGIGGSDVAAILGLCPKEWGVTRDTLLREKVTGAERETTYSMREGNRLEPVARELYARRVGCTATPWCVEHPEADWARCSLDGVCDHCPEIPGSLPWVVEIKAPNWTVHDYALQGMVPEYYLVQCQWQLYVTGLKRCDFVSYNPRGRFPESQHLAVVTLREDAEIQGQCLYAAADFWDEVKAGREQLAAERRARHTAAAEAMA